MKLPFVSRSKHDRLVAGAKKDGRSWRALEANINADLLAEARSGKVIAERFAERVEKDLDEARSEIRRLTDIIVELKREGREVAHPVDEHWGSYTTEEADADRAAELTDPEYAKRIAVVEEQPESHEQMPTTDGGPHTRYAERLELERAAQKALEAELPDM